MTANIITELVDRFALGPDGVDLRAELDALQSARVSQALTQTGGDVARAAKLLRMTRIDLLRLESRLGRPPTPGGRRPRFEPPPVERIDTSGMPRIERGVEVVSRAVILRLAVEGLTERQIAGRLGCNGYLVERVLREETERKVRALDAEHIAPSDIASRLTLPLARVRRILGAAETRRRPKSSPACAPRKRKPE